MNWRERISGLTKAATFFPPARAELVESASASLGCKLPADLAELLVQSNGVEGEYALGLVWPVERIVADNASFRAHAEFPALYMPFACCLFFADAGNGDQFFFPVLEGVASQDSVFAWNHENDSRVWVAPSLSLYLEWWLSGRIQL